MFLIENGYLAGRTFRIWIGPGKNEIKTSNSSIRDPHFLAIYYPVVTLEIISNYYQ